jgi:hypothetical protein
LVPKQCANWAPVRDLAPPESIEPFLVVIQVCVHACVHACVHTCVHACVLTVKTRIKFARQLRQLSSCNSVVLLAMFLYPTATEVEPVDAQQARAAQLTSLLSLQNDRRGYV